MDGGGVPGWVMTRTSKRVRGEDGRMNLRTNDPEQDALNRGFYVLTNAVGADDNFVGADAAASWWHRNFRMYAIVQRFAQPGERVLVIGGQGHIAILRRLLADDREREAVDVRPFL